MPQTLSLLLPEVTLVDTGFFIAAHGNTTCFSNLLTSEAEIVSDPNIGLLRVHFPGFGDQAGERMLEPFIEVLNKTRTIYPGIDLAMICGRFSALRTVFFLISGKLNFAKLNPHAV